MTLLSQIPALRPARPTLRASPRTGLCVVVGLDFTDADGPAFDLAARIAMRSSDSQIHLIHVFPEAPSAQRSEDLIDHLRLYVEEKTAVARGLGGVAVGIHLRGGAAVPELVRMATEVNADFIVVGSHQGLHLTDWIAGSTVERLIRGSAFPVLVAPFLREAVKPEPTIEPACSDCIAARFASAGAQWWCERHSNPGRRGHTYSYQRELPMATHDSAITPTGIDF